MLVETKRINTSETLLYFSSPLPLQGTFIATNTIPSDCQLLTNIAIAELHQELLLTSDFIYLKSKTAEVLTDLEALVIAEIDDYLEANPAVQHGTSKNIEAKITILLKTIIAPRLQKDGGNIELISYNNGHAIVKFLGKCHGCPYAERTLKEHVEKKLIRYLPEIREVTLE